jgi:hypothetical protein
LKRAASSSSEEIDEVLDGPISFMIGNFEFALGPMSRFWLVVEAAVSKWTAETLVDLYTA